MTELTPEVFLEAKAKRYALEKHGKQMYGEKPYSYHLEQVVANVKLRMKGDPMLPVYVAVAWLHDTMEDTATTFEDIELEFGLAVAFSVDFLTKSKDVDYHTYIENIIGCAVAREVKICDTMANLTESFKSGNAKGLAKYPKQLDMLLKGEVY